MPSDDEDEGGTQPHSNWPTERASRLSGSDLWPRMPRSVEDAVEDFDCRRRAFTERSLLAVEAIGKDPYSSYAQEDFELSLQALRMCRFAVQPLRMRSTLPKSHNRVPAAHDPTVMAVGSSRGGPWMRLPEDAPPPEMREAPPKRPWKLETSIWAPRRNWADSRDFVDTDACIAKALRADWEAARRDGKLDKFIVKHDDDKDDAAVSGIDSGRGPTREVQEVFAVLQHHARLFYSIFDFYAASGTSMDIFQIQLNAYTQLVHDCGLLDPDNHTCNAVVFDQMFVAINAGAARDEKYNHMRALCRHELLNIFVRTAIQRYVLQGTMKDVSDALDLLMKSIVSVEAPAMAQHVPDDFRWAACYTAETDTVLRRHEASLRYIFEGFARGDGELGNKMRSTSLLGYDEWARFIAMTNLVDPAFPASQRCASCGRARAWWTRPARLTARS